MPFCSFIHSLLIFLVLCRLFNVPFNSVVVSFLSFLNNDFAASVHRQIYRTKAKAVDDSYFQLKGKTHLVL